MFTIGEFSKLCCISARMLRHYDAIGLLSPIMTGSENGYRFYDSSQLYCLNKIEKLKKYGFSLAEIKSLIGLNDYELDARMKQQRKHLLEQLNSLLKTLRQMETDLHLSKEELNMHYQNYHVIIMNNPSQKVFALKRTIAITPNEIYQLINDLKIEMNKRTLTRAGVIQLEYLSQEFSAESMEVEAQIPVLEDYPDVKILPETPCAAVTHKGGPENIHFAYEAICHWLEQHPQYQMGGNSIERFLNDESTVDSAKELETGILFPVKSVS